MVKPSAVKLPSVNAPAVNAPAVKPQAEDPRVTRTRKDVTTAALAILLEQGWSAVTHGAVAKQSGHSRATIYGHWPTQTDLVRDAFKHYEQMPHSTRSGDIKTDLVAEMKSYCDAMVTHSLDRALSMLAEKAQTTDEAIPIRDSFVSAGEKPIRETLALLDDQVTIEALTLMLCGMVTHSVLMHGEPPTRAVIDKAVAIALAGMEHKQ
jgi:AcrR family transcriptional regulator